MHEDMRPLYIFDIDGTVALIDHRRPVLDKLDDNNRWREFYSLCDKDAPNEPVIKILEMLRITGAEVWFFSGRSEEVRDKTVSWLAEHTSFMTHDLTPLILNMRLEGDYTADDKLKEIWFNSMLQMDKDRLVAIFDDRQRVVDMWRNNGVTCLQVADGNF